MQNDTQCPFLLQKRLPIRQMIQIARYNKVSFILKHMITCEHCQHIITKNDRTYLQHMFTYMRPRTALLLNYEKILFEHTAKKLHAPYVFFKTLERAHTKDKALGSDIDVLVHISDIPRIVTFYKAQGYKVRAYDPKEYNLISPKTALSIDIHKTIAYPHTGNIPQKDNLVIKSLNAECFTLGTHCLPKELFVVVQTVRFWTNDLGRGLRQLQDILETSIIYEEEIDWDVLVKKLIACGYYSRYITALLLGKKMFAVPHLPAYIEKRNIPLRVSLLVWLLDIVDVSYVDDFMKWESKDSTISKKYHLHYVFVNFMADLDYSFFRLFRPQLLKEFMHLATRAIVRDFTMK